MRWFEGGIAQAVALSKAQNAIFVVFVQGEDPSSQKLSDIINSEEVSSKLEGENFVAVCLQSGTETFNQFSQIYRSPAVPSLYFIGRQGAPIEIVTEASDSSLLLNRISAIENIHFGKESQVNKTSNVKTSEKSQPSSSSSNDSPPACSSDKNDQEEQNSDVTPGSASLGDRVERAKELLQEKRLQKQFEEEEDIREKELKRRQEGKNMQELKRWQQEQEMKQLQEERRRERRMEQEARQRVLEQIAQDRANRSAKVAAVSQTPAHTQTTSASVTSNSNEARLQFRLPDGSTHSHTFSADATLVDVRQYLLSNVTLPFQDFTLATMFPRREFTFGDNSTSLRDLQLTPSSVVLVLAAGGHSVVRHGGVGILGMFQMAFMTLTYPIVRIFTYVRSLVFGVGGDRQTGNSPQTNTVSNPPSQTPSEKRSHRRTGGSGGSYRRAGNSNVHRLHQNHSSSDDDNNTWNGNSTQQM